MTPHSGTSADSAHGMADSGIVQPEQLFRAIFEQAAVGIALIETSTGRFVRINQRYCEIVGLSQDDMTATTFMAITHPEDLQVDLSNMEELKAGRIRSFSMEKRYFRPDGSIAWVDLTVSPMWERGEQPTFHIAVVQDITERKQAQEVLRVTEGRLTEILNHSTAMIFMKDREGRYLLVNRAFERQFGLMAEQILGKTDMDIFPAKQAAMFQANDREVIRTGIPMEFEEVAQYGGVEHTSIATKFPLRNAESSIYAICGIVTDITDRKRAEQNLADLNAMLEQEVSQRTKELRDSRHQLQAIIEGTSDAVYLKDAQGRYLIFNEAAGRFVGRHPEEALGKDDTFLFPHAEAQVLMEQDRRTMYGEKTLTYEETVTTADGVKRTFHSTKGPMFDAQGHVAGLFGISRDITERKRSEIALRVSEERLLLAQEAGKIGTFDWDIVNEKVTWSPQLERIWGLPVGGYGGTYADWARQVHPADRAEAERLAQRALVDPTHPYVFEHRIIQPNGRERWISAHATIVRDETGRPMRMVGINIDITERKYAEEQLRESEERLNQATHLAKIGIFDHDHRTEALYWSPMMREIYGVPPDEPASLAGYIQLLHPDDRDAIVAAVRRAHDPLGDGLYRVEHRLVRRNGTVRWVSLQSRTYFEGEGSARTPVRTMGAMVDVTERKEAEEVLSQLNETLEQRVAERTEALLVSEHFTKEVLDSLSAHVAVLDASGVIVAVNRVWEKAAQLNDPSGLAQVSLGANYVKVCESAANKSSEARRALKGIIDVLAGRKQVFESEYLCVWPGHKQWFSMRVTPLGGRDGGAVVAHEDITARKRAEEAVRESYHRLQTVSREVQVAEERERSRLSRELHDEFGQLLGVLKFTLSTTEEGLRKKAVKTGSFAKHLKGAMETVDQLFVSIRSIVAALRPPVLEQLGLSVALRMLASDVIAPLGVRCRVIVRRKGLPNVLPVAVEGALYRTAQELLTNVVRHAKATHATLTLSCTDRVVKLVVQDNGRGFTVKKSAPHNEFGLQGIRERAELLGGAVAIDSRPSMTAVTVSLPLGIPSVGHHTTGASPNPRQATRRRRGRNDHT